MTKPQAPSDVEPICPEGPRLSTLLAKNRAWADRQIDLDPDYFQRMSQGQSPAFTVVSCCDSRTDPNTLLQGNLGELFVYKNVANLVKTDDLSIQTALQFSIDSLKVNHILIFGHHGCGGVRLAMGDRLEGTPGDWLHSVRALAHDHHLFGAQTAKQAEHNLDKLCELNVISQIRNAALSQPVQNAWARGDDLCISGLVYCLRTGAIENLQCTVSAPDQIDLQCFEAMQGICARYRALAA